MRVGVVSSNSLQNVRYIKRTNVNFRGLFGEPNLSEKFDYGMQALDNNSVLVVTSNPESSDVLLSMYAEKIDTPIMKKYTLKVDKKDLKGRDELDSDFAVFKKDDRYYILGLGKSLFSYINVKKEKEPYKKENSVHSGEIKELADGVILDTGESCFDKDWKKFVFKPPYRFSPRYAERYLEVKNIKDIKSFNKRTISSLTQAPKKQNNDDKLTFDKIGGLDDVIDKLKKYVVRPINYPQVYQNIRLNKGILLYGPPRCGKTMLGKALANECDAKFYEYNANEFRSAQVGSSENNIREVFKKAMLNAPSITFIDEFDSIAKTRDGSSNARFDDSIVNQVLGCMSDLEKSKAPAFIVAATNMKNLIDKAMLGTGRFGLHLEVPMPNLEGIKQIFKIHAKNQSIENDVPVEAIAKQMHDNAFNGSDVAEAVSDAYFNALERLGMNEKMDAKNFSFEDFKKIFISKEDFLSAIRRIAKQKKI